MNELEILDEITIENMIYEIRGKQVMLDSDLAKLYKCKNGTKEINQAVKNNVEKFPERFSWRLSDEESKIFLVKNFDQKETRGGKYKNPRVFTEQGVAMLATVLKSKTATKVSIAIMDAFVIMRKYISNNLLEQKYINDLVLQNTEDIKLLKQSFSKFEELSNEIYFDGQIYDAYSKIKDILSMAKKKLIIIDAYADKVVLDMIKDLSVKVTLIVKNKSLLTKTDINKYNSQYSNLTIVYDDTFHDRYFIIDNDIIYHCGASINHAGSKTFSINKLEDEIVKKSLINKIGDTIYNFKK
ncbi:MAG: ORF6N domain-containing protein [Bacilli bacterium]|nr:ORF6N domain-containing protein [Bacilli bacterium]